MWYGQEAIRLDADNPQQRLHQSECIAQKIRGRYEEVLADGTVYAALNLATEESTEIEDGGQAARGANDVPILGRGRLGDNKHEGEDGDDEGESFHSLRPLRGSPTSGLLVDWRETFP